MVDNERNTADTLWMSNGHQVADAAIASSDAHVVMMVNGGAKVFDKQGGLLRAYGLAEIWGAHHIANVGRVDIQVQYDAGASRWVLTALHEDGDPLHAGSLDIAVTSDPTNPAGWASWHFTKADRGDTGSGTDFPHLSISADAVYLSYLQGGVQRIIAWSKADLYAGNPAPAWRKYAPDFGGFAQPVRGLTASPRMYFMVASGTNSETLVTWDSPFGANVVTVSAPMPLAIHDDAPGFITQLDGDQFVHANGATDGGARYHEGSIYGIRGVGVGDYTALRWYRLNPLTLTMLEQGVLGSGTNIHRLFPNLTVNSRGGIIIGYMVAGPTLWPGLRAIGVTRERAVLPEVVLTNGDGPVPTRNNVTRTGDYSGMELDPDGLTAWFTSPYGVGDTTFAYKMWVAGIRLGS
jgi:hypothetical protein